MVDLNTYLNAGQTTREDLLASVRRFYGLEDGDELLSVGSLAEGIGTSKSDLDLLVITQRKREISGCSGWMVGNCVVDLEEVSRKESEALYRRLSDWSKGGWSLAENAKFSDTERRMMHRILHGVQLWPSGPDQNAMKVDRLQDLALLKFHLARHLARATQVDMMGVRQQQDFASLSFMTQELLGHAIDALLAIFQFTNPSPKWRSRLLEMLPSASRKILFLDQSSCSLSHLFWNLHRLPSSPDEKLVSLHSLRCASFARTIFFVGELKLRYQFSPDQIKDRANGFVANFLPSEAACSWEDMAFDLDVDFLLSENAITFGRLNSIGDQLELPLNHLGIAGILSGFHTLESLTSPLGNIVRHAAQQIHESGLGSIADPK